MLDPVLPRVATRRVHQPVQQFPVLLVYLLLPIELRCLIADGDSCVLLILINPLIRRPGGAVHLRYASLLRILAF